MGIFGSFIPGFKQNWKVVFLSIVGAATFWFFNAMSKDYDTRVEYPVEFQFDRENVVILQPLAKTVKIDVSSGGWMLLRKTIKFNANPIQITLENPTDIKYLTRSSLIPIITEQLEGLNLRYVVTDTIYFDIEEKITKRAYIAVDSFNIPLHDNYRVTSKIKVNRDSISLTGPKSMMDELMEPIYISFDQIDIDHNVDEEFGYVLDPLIQANPPKTKVNFEVARFLLKQVSIPVEFRNFPNDSSVVPSRRDIQIFFTISESLVDEVKASDFSVTADYKMLNRRDSTVSPMLLYGHEKAVDIVLAYDKLKVDYVKR